MFIYKITNTINKKVYIGQTRQKRPISRWHEHISTAKKGKHYNTYLQAAFHKYGIDAFSFEIIAQASNLSELDELERKWICELDSMNRDKGYNRESGGSPNKIISQETREKHRQSLLGIKRSPETIARLRLARAKQKVSPKSIEAMRQANLGRKVTEETRKKISEAQKGEKGNNWKKPMPEETKKKISAKLKGRIQKPITEETRQKLSESHKGQIPWNKGKPITEETRQKCSESHKGQIPWNKGKTYKIKVNHG